MDGGVLKVHHPCLLTCDGDYRACDDFRLGDGPFCLFRFADIFVVPAGAFSVLPPGDRHHNNRPGLSSSFGKCKIGVRTIDIQWRSGTRRACLRPCKPPEGAVGKKYCGELPDACGSSCIKPEGATSGFSIFMPIRLADHPLGHKPNRRSEPDGNIYQQTGRIKGMIWIIESFGN